MSISLIKLTKFLDVILSNPTFQDISNNGLQLENNGHVTKVLAGVDASLRLLHTAAACGADCIICHHGLSWGDSLKYITGLNHRLISFAIENNIAIYASHLPLDAHPRYGNNAQLCGVMGLLNRKPAFDYHGGKIGMTANFAQPISFNAFCQLVRTHINPEIKALAFGPKRVQTIGVVSGGAADMIDQATALGVDAFLTGEPSLLGYNLAENLNQNVVFAGHYATERFGVCKLAELITQKLKLPTEFADFKISI